MHNTCYRDFIILPTLIALLVLAGCASHPVPQLPPPDAPALETPDTPASLPPAEPAAPPTSETQKEDIYLAQLSSVEYPLQRAPGCYMTADDGDGKLTIGAAIGKLTRQAAQVRSVCNVMTMPNLGGPSMKVDNCRTTFVIPAADGDGHHEHQVEYTAFRDTVFPSSIVCSYTFADSE